MVIIGIDLDLTLRRIEHLPQKRLAQRVGIHFASLLQCRCKKVDLNIGRLTPARDISSRSELSLVGLKKAPVRNGLYRTKIRRSGDVTNRSLTPNRANLAFIGGQARNRAYAAVTPSCMIGAIEFDTRLPNHRRKYCIGLSAYNLSYYISKTVGAGFKIEIPFSHHFATALSENVSHNAVGFIWIDIIGSNEKNPLSVGIHEIIRERNTILIGARTSINDIGGIFEALVDRRIEK